MPESAYHLTMRNTNQLSERLARMRQEMNDVKIINARYWVKSPHTALDKSAHALCQGATSRHQAGIGGDDETVRLVGWKRWCFRLLWGPRETLFQGYAYNKVCKLIRAQEAVDRAAQHGTTIEPVFPR